jgi:hypothetical protein
MNRLLVLKQIDLFGHLSLDEIALLAEAMEFETRIAGERIITKANPRESFSSLRKAPSQSSKARKSARSRPSALVSASARWVCSTIRSDRPAQFAARIARCSSWRKIASSASPDNAGDRSGNVPGIEPAHPGHERTSGLVTAMRHPR